MGDEIVILAMEILYGGLIQIDIKNETKNEMYRVFAEPKEFFSMVGNALQKCRDAYLYEYEKACQQSDLAEIN